MRGAERRQRRAWRDLIFDEVAHDDGLYDLLERVLHLRFHGVALRQL
jgi:hypothetical protein|tara:strand:+ start:464 stop:604 length:141 start_codon:yes stop_codon:yes gene_type:complete